MIICRFVEIAEFAAEDVFTAQNFVTSSIFARQNRELRCGKKVKLKLSGFEQIFLKTTLLCEKIRDSHRRLKKSLARIDDVSPTKLAKRNYGAIDIVIFVMLTVSSVLFRRTEL